MNYEAREYGIKRGFRVDQCKASCPSVTLFKVPELRGKADLTMYRNASMEVFEILQSYDEKIVFERASIDEAFLDLSNFIKEVAEDHVCMEQDISDAHVAGVPPYSIDHFVSSSNIVIGSLAKTEEAGLIIAAKMMNRLKKEIKDKTQFSCSCGISRNKIMAKLACGFKKPNGLSIFPKAGLQEIWKKTPIKKVRNLGGKLGSLLMSQFQIELMSDLSSLSTDQIENCVGSKSMEWIIGILNGDDEEPVTSRLISKSVGCGKNFSGLTSFDEVNHWVTQLSTEMVERLKEDQRVNQRRARSMVFAIRLKKNFENCTKTLPIPDYNVEMIAEELMKTVASKFTITLDPGRLSEPISSLYLTASKFVDEDVILKSAVHKTARLDRYFTAINKSNLIPVNFPLGCLDETSKDSDGSILETLSEQGLVQEIVEEEEEEVGDNIDEDEEEYVSDDCESVGDEEDMLVINVDPNLNAQNSFFYRKTLELMNK